MQEDSTVRSEQSHLSMRGSLLKPVEEGVPLLFRKVPDEKQMALGRMTRGSTLSTEDKLLFLSYVF